jgi:hypothetical protein
MFYLGLLSIIQIAFLPGFLALRALKLTDRLGRTLVLSFALSLVINHFLVVWLVLAGCYRPAMVYGLFALEVALLAWTARKWPAMTLADVLQFASGPTQRGQVHVFGRAVAEKAGPSSRKMDRTPDFAVLLRGAAWLLILGFAAQAICHAGDIFQQWDAVVSWNRWALDWAANRLPRLTAEYPQLLPTNLSLSYVFIQDSSIWFFAKGWLFLFCLFLLVAMCDLAGETGNSGYALGAIFTYVLLVCILRFRYLSSGYADVPVAFLAYAGVYALLLARGAADAKTQTKYVFLGAVLCAGAALTKQAGLLIAVVYPLLAWLLVYRAVGPRAVPSRAGWTRWLFLAAVLVTLIAPWYLYKQLAMLHGDETRLTGYLLHDIHEGRNLLQRLIHAGGLLRGALTLPGLVALLLAMVFAFRDYSQRWLVLVAAAPLALAWALGFSYDLRNLALAIPLAGAAAGVGAVELAKTLARQRATAGSSSGASGRDTAGQASSAAHAPAWVRRVLSLRVGYVVLLLIVPLALFATRIARGDLVARQRALQRSICMADVDRLLYQCQQRPGIRGAIVTDYLPMQWLPDLQQYYVQCAPENATAFQTIYARPDIRFALLHKTRTSPQVWQYLEAANGPGSSRLLGESQAYRFYQKRENR